VDAKHTILLQLNQVRWLSRGCVAVFCNFITIF